MVSTTSWSELNSSHRPTGRSSYRMVLAEVKAPMAIHTTAPVTAPPHQVVTALPMITSSTQNE